MRAVHRMQNKTISIHALREEGDRRRTKQDHTEKKISIHALREEGDFQRVVDFVKLF